MDHHVRIATAADAESAARLLVDFNREFGSPAPEAAQIAPHLAALLESQHTFAVLGGAPPAGIALVTLRPNVWFDGPVALLDELYVRPDLRGHGMGTALVDAVVRHSRSHGVALLEVNVDESDTDALRFYDRHGFAQRQPDTGERAFYLSRTIT